MTSNNPLIDLVRDSVLSGSRRRQEKSSVVRIELAKVAPIDKAAHLDYPYEKLSRKSQAYRGFPIDGTKSMKKSSCWKIQIVPPAAGAPSAPLPQFPQQEVLTRTKKGYVGVKGKALSETQTAYNSGEFWLEKGGEKPTSEFFFTAGYTEGSAVKLQKPYTESIYRSVISGTPVPVKVAQTTTAM